MLFSITKSESELFRNVITITAMKETLGQRIKRHRKAAGLSQAALATACGWKSQSRVGNYETDTREPSLADLRLIANAIGVDESEIILDYKPSAPEGGAEAVESNATMIGPFDVWDDETPLDGDEVYVPYLKEVELSAGRGRTVVEQSHTRKLRFGKITLRRQNVQPSEAVCVTVGGNSMEPVLPDGSTVGVDQGATTVIDGKMYAINHGGQLRVKTLYRLPGGGIRMRSFNRDEHPDEEYSAEEMVAKEIVILGKVFWSSVLW